MHCSAFSLFPAVIHILGEIVSLNGPPNGPPNEPSNAALKYQTKTYIQCPSAYSECPEISDSMHQCLHLFTFASKNTEFVLQT